MNQAPGVGTRSEAGVGAVHLGLASASDPPCAQTDAVLDSPGQFRCAWTTCCRTAHTRLMQDCDTTDSKWDDLRAWLKTTGHDNKLCRLHSADISRLRRKLCRGGVSSPSRSSSSASTVGSSTPPTPTFAEPGLSSFEAADSAAADDARTFPLAARRLFRQPLSLSALWTPPPSPESPATAPSSPAQPFEPVSERTVMASSTADRPAERRHDSEREATEPRNGGAHPGRGAAPRGGRKCRSPPTAAVLSSSADSAGFLVPALAPQSAPTPAPGDAFAVPVSRSVRRSASLATPSLTPLPLRSSLAHRSASVGALTGSAAVLQPLPVTPRTPPNPSLTPLIRVVDRRPCTVRRDLDAAAAGSKLADAKEKRERADAKGRRSWQKGYDTFGDEWAPWQFDVMLGVLAMTVCNRWDPYHPSRSVQGLPRCEGSMVPDGVKRVVTPAFVCGAHCDKCGRRVSLYNCEPMYVAIGYGAAPTDATAQAIAEELRVAEAADSNSVEVEAEEEKGYPGPAPGPVPAQASAPSSPWISLMGGKEEAEQGEEDGGVDNDTHLDHARSVLSTSSVPGAGAAAAASVPTVRRRRSKYDAQLQRQQQQPHPTSVVHCRQQFVVPPEEPTDISLKGFYHVTVLKMAAMCLLCGMRASSISRLSNWSECVQMVRQTTLYRYYSLIQHYINTLYQRDQDKQMVVLRQTIREARERAAAQGLSPVEVEQAGRVLVLAADGAWSSRGWGAKAFSYVVCNLTRPWQELDVVQSRSSLPPVCYMRSIQTSRVVKEYEAKRLFKVLFDGDPGSGSVLGPGSVPGPRVVAEQAEASIGRASDANNEDDERPVYSYEKRRVMVKGYSNAGNWTPSKGSAAMEGACAEDFIDDFVNGEQLRDGIRMFVTDGDTKMASLMEAKCHGVTHVRDPGHMYKKLRKLYEELCTTRQCFDGLPYRMYTWLRRCHFATRLVTCKERDETKRSDLMHKLMQYLMVQMIYHYHNLCDPTTCPHATNQPVTGLLDKDKAEVEATINEWHARYIQLHIDGNRQPVETDVDVPASQSQSSTSSSSSSISTSAVSSSSFTSRPRSQLSLDDYRMDENSTTAAELSQHDSASDTSTGRGRRKRQCRVTFTDNYVPYDEEMAFAQALSESQHEDEVRRMEEHGTVGAQRVDQTSTSNADTDPEQHQVDRIAGLQSKDKGARKGKGRGRGGSLGGDRGRDPVTDPAPVDSIRVVANAVSGKRSSKMKAVTVAAIESDDVSSDDDDSDDGEYQVSTAKKATRGRRKASDKGLEGHINKLTASGTRCRDGVLKELERRLQQCEDAEERGEQRPYGTSASEAGARQLWRMWIELKTNGPNGRTHSQTFTSLVVASIFDAKMKSICHGYGTTYNESFNSARSRYTPKEVLFHEYWECRSQLCVLNRNLGPTWPKQLMEMMGLPWTERDQRRVDRAEVHVQQLNDENERKRKARARADRFKQLSKVMRREGGGDEYVITRLAEQMEEEQIRMETAASSELRSRARAQRRAERDAEANGGAGTGARPGPGPGAVTEADAWAAVGSVEDVVATLAESELSEPLQPVVRRRASAGARGKVRQPQRLRAKYKSAAEKQVVEAEPVELDSDNNDKENVESAALRTTEVEPVSDSGVRRSLWSSSKRTCQSTMRQFGTVLANRA
jgi:hypothetical protein